MEQPQNLPLNSLILPEAEGEVTPSPVGGGSESEEFGEEPKSPVQEEHDESSEEESR